MTIINVKNYHIIKQWHNFRRQDKKATNKSNCFLGSLRNEATLRTLKKIIAKAQNNIVISSSKSNRT